MEHHAAHPRRIRDLMAAARGNILDVRAAELHEAGHLPESVSYPLEPQLALQPEDRREAWLTRNLPSVVLSPRHEPLLIVAQAADLARSVAAHLQSRGRTAVTALALDRHAVELLDGDLRRRGRSSRVLWRPPDFLRRWAHLLPPPPAGRVLDLACGSGRAAVWLARQGWSVTGVDHQPDALDLASGLAAASGVRIDLLQADLRACDSVPAGEWAAVLMLRFLERDLVKSIPAHLGHGGVVVLSTFRDAPGFLGNPRPVHRLRRDEAATFWPPGFMELLVHQEGYDADGRPSAGVVARRS